MGWMMDGLTIDHQMISSKHSGTPNLCFFLTGEIWSKSKIQNSKNSKKDFFFLGKVFNHHK
jgi:hypothetical protein